METIHGMVINFNFIQVSLYFNNMILKYVSYAQDNVTCHIREVPFRGVNCSDAAGKQYPLSWLNSNRHDHNASYRWDDNSLTPWYNYLVREQGCVFSSYLNMQFNSAICNYILLQSILLNSRLYEQGV